MNMRKLLYCGIMLFFISCSTEITSSYEKRLCEAKWLYYESNFTKSNIACFNTGVVDTNICFVEGLIIDTANIGDTLEISIYTTLDGVNKCIPYKGIAINLFGFYPNVDTVVYRANFDEVFDRIPENWNSNTSNFEWAGAYTRSMQKIMFKSFIKSNKEKLNSWLKSEAHSKGYL